MIQVDQGHDENVSDDIAEFRISTSRVKARVGESRRMLSPRDLEDNVQWTDVVFGVPKAYWAEAYIAFSYEKIRMLHETLMTVCQRTRSCIDVSQSRKLSCP